MLSFTDSHASASSIFPAICLSSLLCVLLSCIGDRLDFEVLVASLFSDISLLNSDSVEAAIFRPEVVVVRLSVAVVVVDLWLLSTCCCIEIPILGTERLNGWACSLLYYCFQRWTNGSFVHYWLDYMPMIAFCVPQQDHRQIFTCCTQNHRKNSWSRRNFMSGKTLHVHALSYKQLEVKTNRTSILCIILHTIRKRYHGLLYEYWTLMTFLRIRLSPA